MIRRLGRPSAIAVALVVAGCALAGCGVEDGDADRHEIEARTCRSVLARLGLPSDEVDAERFAATLTELRESGQPYSTLEPFLRACRSFG